ncbi:ATP-binding protein [Proteinivorax hydrogeniformans]|uniref:ATP-binding protein n=1 Tax=Proteinivorax hydrogeniformans TaxID=1826727 RepID=A0AAU8HWF4_9FIRM
MKDLSHVILDLVQNSISADADQVSIEVFKSKKQNLLSVCITDNGKGMNEQEVKKSTDPYYTTRTTRDIGLGLPLIKMMAKQADGDFKINSKPQNGTCVYFSFALEHWDCPPVGDLAATFISFFVLQQDITISLKVDNGSESFELSNQEIYDELSADQITKQWVLDWVKELIEDNIMKILREG